MAPKVIKVTNVIVLGKEDHVMCMNDLDAKEIRKVCSYPSLHNFVATRNFTFLMAVKCFLLDHERTRGLMFC